MRRSDCSITDEHAGAGALIGNGAARLQLPGRFTLKARRVRRVLLTYPRALTF